MLGSPSLRLLNSGDREEGKESGRCLTPCHTAIGMNYEELLSCYAEQGTLGRENSIIRRRKDFLYFTEVLLETLWLSFAFPLLLIKRKALSKCSCLLRILSCISNKTQKLTLHFNHSCCILLHYTVILLSGYPLSLVILVNVMHVWLWSCL